jgi:hypothetical protein
MSVTYEPSQKPNKLIVYWISLRIKILSNTDDLAG